MTENVAILHFLTETIKQTKNNHHSNTHKNVDQILLEKW